MFPVSCCWPQWADLKAAFAKQGKSWEGAVYDRRRTTGQSFVHVWHELAITEFLLSVWEAGQAHPDWKLPVLERRSLKTHPSFEINRSRHRRLIPDGLFLIHHPKGRILSFLEIDTGTESRRQLENKLESYQVWSQSPLGQEYLCNLYRQTGATTPQPKFRLLFVIAPKISDSEENRLQEFHELVADQPDAQQKRLWYTSAGQLRAAKPTSLLNAPIWFRGSDTAYDEGSDQPSYRFFSF